MSALQIILGVFVDHLFYFDYRGSSVAGKPFFRPLWCNCRWCGNVFGKNKAARLKQSSQSGQSIFPLLFFIIALAGTLLLFFIK